MFCDPANQATYTHIPFINYTKISDPCGDGWYGVTCEDYETEKESWQLFNRSVTQMWLYSNNLQGSMPLRIADLHSLIRDKLMNFVPPYQR